jgi:hypothetical protein
MILVSIIYNLVASALYLGVAGGFTLEWLVGFVKEANNLKGSSGGTQLNQLLASIKKACADTAKLFADTPDVATMEEKFLAYMGRHGGTMADHKAAIDKSVHQFRATVAKLKGAGGPGGSGQGCRCCHNRLGRHPGHDLDLHDDNLAAEPCGRK